MIKNLEEYISKQGMPQNNEVFRNNGKLYALFSDDEDFEVFDARTFERLEPVSFASEEIRNLPPDAERVDVKKLLGITEEKVS